MSTVAVAQLAEQRFVVPLVVGSIPIGHLGLPAPKKGITLMKKILMTFVITLVMILSTGCQAEKPLENSIEEIIICTLPVYGPSFVDSQTQEAEESSAAASTEESVESTTIETEPLTTEETEPPTTAPEPTEPITTVAPTEPPTEPAPVYTFKDLEGKVMYVIATVNIRTLPSTDGEIVTTRSVNEEVWVTGQCNETGWYRISLEGQTFYISGSYLSDTKITVVRQQPTTTQPPASTATGFVYYTVSGRWPERAYEQYLYNCLVDRGIAWWYPYAIAQIWTESCWTPTSYNGVDAGICQFNEQMFPARATHHANYSNADVWNPYDSLYVYSFYIRDILAACGNNIEAAWSYYIKGHFNDPHSTYIAACWKWYNSLEAQ